MLYASPVLYVPLYMFYVLFICSVLAYAFSFYVCNNWFMFRLFYVWPAASLTNTSKHIFQNSVIVVGGYEATTEGVLWDRCATHRPMHD